MTTTLESIREQASDAVAAQAEFLKHCEIHYKDINDDNSGVFVVGWNCWRWATLDLDAQRPLGLARKRTELFVDTASSAVTESEPDRQKALDKAISPLLKVLAQDGGAPGKSIEAVEALVGSSIGDALAIIEALPSAHGDGGRWLIPDANALVWQPDLTLWESDEKITLVIVPRVIAELDEIKNRNNSAAEKADKVIRQLNEFDRRGDTFEGVRVAGKLFLREVAVEPRFDNVPSWLDPSHSDDQIVASALRLSWTDLNADVSLVTRDRNMKNKARFARLHVLDVADLASDV